MPRLSQPESSVYQSPSALALVGDFESERLAEFAAHRVAERFGLPLHVAELLCSLAGLGGARQ